MLSVKLYNIVQLGSISTTSTPVNIVTLLYSNSFLFSEFELTLKNLSEAQLYMVTVMHSISLSQYHINTQSWETEWKPEIQQIYKS